MRTVLPVVSAVAIAYLLLCAWVYAIQRGQMYFPTPAVDHPGAQAFWIESKEDRIKVWMVRRPGPSALLYFGGNADDVAGHIDTFSEALPEHSLYLVNYRGYGGSRGRPSEAALFADALAVYDQVRVRHSDIAAMGRSLGSGVAVYLATRRPVSKLVLVTPFDSLLNVAKAHFGWLPVGLLMRDRYDSSSRAPAVTVPALVVIAGEDEIIPRERSEALADAFRPGQAQVVVVPDVGHNTLDLSPTYLATVQRFVSEQ